MQISVVIPVRGRSDLLAHCLSAIKEAKDRYAEAEIIVVDNNPTETGDEVIEGAKSFATVVRSRAATVAAVRNEGVAAATDGTKILAFLDSDCIARPDFLEQISRAFSINEQIAIAGCKVVSPADGHWTERAADELHREAGDGRRSHINSGCLAIRSEVFRSIGGFSEALPANEDYDLCDKVHKRNGLIWQFEALSVIHLGNPKTVRGFFQRLRWHGRGSFTADRRFAATTMSLLVLLNSATLMLGFILAVSLLLNGLVWQGIVILGTATVAIPLVAWIARLIQFRRWIRPHFALPLLQITFLARQFGIVDQYLAIRRLGNPKR